MNGKIPMTVTGNLTADPELRFTPKGHGVVRFTVASNPRKYNQQTDQWEDGQATFMRCQVWRNQAENFAESALVKGTRITVSGVLTQHTWEDDNQQKKSMFVLDAEDVSASMRNAQVTVKRIVRDHQQSNDNSDPRGANTFADTTSASDEPPF